MTDDYIELHASSAFSFLEAASHPEDLVERASDLDMSAMALLDRNGIYGAPRFHAIAKQYGMLAHIGAEVAVADTHFRRTPSCHQNQREVQAPRLPLLCTSRTGYSNLCQLITRFKMSENLKIEGASTYADIEEFAADLICLTGGDEGPLASALDRVGYHEAFKTVEQLTHIFGKHNVYVELQRHGTREAEWRNQAALSIAESLHLPVLATNGVRYAMQKDREVLDVFTCIRHHTDLEHAGRLLALNSQRYLRSSKEMKALFPDIPDAITNTILLSQRLTFELSDLGYKFPAYDVPGGNTMDSYLRKLVISGIADRYRESMNSHLRVKATQQAERELALIATLQFSGYFLIVWDIVRYCQENDILVQGRGSAANSVVCFALKITAVDPIGMDLLFERFLSESRDEWPDIDLDLPSGSKREKAIQYIYRRYGELGAAMTANVITYRGKSAAREVGKALGFNEEALARLSGLVGQWEWRKPGEFLTDNFKHAGFDLEHPRIAKYVELCKGIQNLPRHLGQHSGGMVISQGNLNRIVPIERASMPGRTVVQWDKDDCSEMGMIKVDLLGLGMMAVVKDCLDLIPQHYGVPVDLAHLPDDEQVYKTLCRADTVGMFQVESRAQMASLPRNNPRCFYDLVVQVAIIRPGPIVGKMMHPYMRRRQGKEDVSYPTQSLEPVLQRTLGIPLFQEQLLKMAMVVANFTGAKADELRKAVGMRRTKQRMQELEIKLRAGMSTNNIPSSTQELIVQSIASFALYGFPESHAASFALIAYASACFKVTYPAAFICAMLNNQPMGFYAPAVLVKDAQRHGLRIRPVDIQISEKICTIAREIDTSLSLRLGLNYAKGLSSTAADDLIAARNKGGPFMSTNDLARRVPSLNRRDLLQLAQIGALNWVEGVTHRRDALWQVEQVSRPAGPLLDHSEDADRLRTAPLNKMTTNQRMAADYSGTGITVGPHPMAYLRSKLKADGVSSAHDLLATKDGEFVIGAGCIIARQRPGTAQGFIFLSMEDENWDCKRHRQASAV